jgi:hypothetical protein
MDDEVSRGAIAAKIYQPPRQQTPWALRWISDSSPLVTTNPRWESIVATRWHRNVKRTRPHRGAHVIISGATTVDEVGVAIERDEAGQIFGAGHDCRACQSTETSDQRNPYHRAPGADSHSIRQQSVLSESSRAVK